MNFTLIGPIPGVPHEASADGIFKRVSPFLTVTFPFPQLGIPKVRLPNGGVVGIWPMARGVGFPERNPAGESCRRVHRRRAKKVQMVGHQNISANEPRIGGSPSLEEEVVDRIVGEEGLFVFRANGQEDDNRAVESLVERGMCGDAAFGEIHRRESSHVKKRQPTQFGGTTSVSSGGLCGISAVVGRIGRAVARGECGADGASPSTGFDGRCRALGVSGGFAPGTARCGWFWIGRFFRGCRRRRLCRPGRRLRGRCRGCGRLRR